MFYVVNESDFDIKKNLNFHLIISERDLLKNNTIFESISFINEACYEGKIDNFVFKILVISDEYSSPFLKLYNDLCQIRCSKLNSIIGEIPIIKIDYSFNFIYSNHEILDLIPIIAKKLNYSASDYNQLQDYIQGIKVRESFFKGYKKTRYIAHDRIHHWVAKSLCLEQPTVSDLLHNYTQVLENNFNELTFSKKESLLIEESIVLALERTLIRQRAESTISTEELKNNFFHFKKDNPSLIRLNELSEPGKVGDHPVWMALWAKKNQKKLEESLQVKLQQVNHNFPLSFDGYLEFLKNKYAFKSTPFKPFENLRKESFYHYLSPNTNDISLRKSSFFYSLSNLGDISKLPRLFFRK